MTTIRKSFDATMTMPIDSDAPKGSFDALVSVFGNVDSYGDVVDKGAFAESLASYAATGKSVPVVWDHQWDDIWSHIGSATAEETDDGLMLHAQLDLDNPTAAQAYKLLSDGRVCEFSFAASVADGGWSLEEQNDGQVIQHLTKLNLIEAGPTLKGANPDTELVSIKHSVDVVAKEGRVLAQKHVDTLKSIRSDIDGIISAVDKTEEKEASAPPGEASHRGDEEEVEKKALDEQSEAFSMASKRAGTQLAFINIIKRKGDPIMGNWKKELEALYAEADQLREENDLTEDQIARVDEIAKRIPELKELIAKQDATNKMLKSLHEPVGSEKADMGSDVPPTGTLGERFINSDAMKSFRVSNPNPESKGHVINIAAKQIGDKRMVRKTDVPGGQYAVPLNTATNSDMAPARLPGIEDVTYRPATTLLDLITSGTTNAPWLQYRQLVSIQNDAGIVGEVTDAPIGSLGLKPISTLSTQTADAHAFTYADGMEVTNQELADDGALVALIDGILTQNIRYVLEDKILNGTGTADDPMGIMHTSGVLQQDFATDAVTSIRKAKGLLQNTSNTSASAIVLNPEDDEQFDLLKDSTGRYISNGPWGTGPQVLWGVPRITSAKIPAGTALMGDFSAVQLLVYEAMSILLFNQHKDYAQRNLNYIRAEMRALQMIRQPAKLAIVDIAG